MEWVKSFLDGRTQQVVLDGIVSSAAPVISGIPKALSWVHCYSLYILTVSHHALSSARIFADDYFLHRCINYSADAKTLQEDLDNLQQLEKDRQMKFNLNRCDVIHITIKGKVVDSDYTIHGQILPHTDKAKYLGVIIDSILSWSTLIPSLRKLTIQTAFLRQNLSSCPPHPPQATCYKALVHPSLNMHQASRTLTHRPISIRFELCSVEQQDL